MTIFCKPVGSGNWSPLRIEYIGPQLVPFVVAVGATFDLAGITWRVCRVMA